MQPGRPRDYIPILLLALALSLTSCTGGQRGDFNLEDHYSKAEYRIPMRDGAKLFTIVYSPKDTSRTYPILLKRSPYSIAPYGPQEYHQRLGPSELFDRDGYIFVFQDVRGRYESDGEFELIRAHIPNKTGPDDVDESSDTYDTITWLLANVPNHNGRVGQWGISYPGWEAAMGMIDAHPALKASSPQASPTDMFIWDDWHHNGAFRPLIALSWLPRQLGLRRDRAADFPFEYGTPWGYKFMLDVGPLSRINELYFHGRIREWNEFMEHGTYDEYWQNQTLVPHLENIRHAVLSVTGWFDSEDFYGPVSIYNEIEKETPDNRSTFVVGPWRHGAWGSEDGDRLGEIDFGSKTSHYFKSRIEHPFFSYYLKDESGWSFPEAVVFETGGNRWHTHDQWPPKGLVRKKLYFRAEGRLSFQSPEESNARAHDSYLSDPDKPVPYTTEIRTDQGHEYLVEDQRFAATRPDVLVYESDVLQEDVTIAGPAPVSLFVSTSGTDSDWIVKLIDVFPGDAPPNDRGTQMGDFQMLVAGMVMRGKFRNSLTIPEPMVPAQVTHIEFDLLDRYHTFLKGHRIMVQVQSTWFPLVDRNPQTFVDIYNAGESDFRKATQRLYRSTSYPSHLVLPIRP